MMKKSLSLVLATLLLSLSATLISAQGAIFRVGMVAPVTLDPAIGSNDPEVLFNRMIYDYLWDVNADGELVPSLALETLVSEDGLTVDVTLLEGVTFHDTTELTAADVVFTYNRLKEVGSPALNLLGEYTVEATDTHAVRFTLARPNADFVFGLASNWAFVLKDGTTTPNVLGEGNARFANFNGTGAFILEDYSPNVSATFVRNANYWGRFEGNVNVVQHVYIEDAQAQIDALKTGAVDFIFKVAYDRLPDLSVDGITTFAKPTNQHPVIRLRSDEGALGEDVRVRQAFKYATDRELLNLNLFDGIAVVGNNDPIGPLYGNFYAPNPATPQYDPARACELLAEAGYPNGLGADVPITFYIDDSFNYVQMAEFLQQDWAQGCIYVELLPRNPGDYYAGADDVAEWLNVDLAVTGWGSRPVPQQYLVEAYATGASYNESHWSDPELDALILEASQTSNLEARAEIYAKISTIFAERGPVIIPFFAPIVGASRSTVGGLNMHPFPGRTDFRSVVIGG
jgi:peptide/nickel transport system substrate-binding protein